MLKEALSNELKTRRRTWRGAEIVPGLLVSRKNFARVSDRAAAYTWQGSRWGACRMEHKSSVHCCKGEKWRACLLQSWPASPSLVRQDVVLVSTAAAAAVAAFTCRRSEGARQQEAGDFLLGSWVEVELREGQGVAMPSWTPVPSWKPS